MMDADVSDEELQVRQNVWPQMHMTGESYEKLWSKACRLGAALHPRVPTGWWASVSQSAPQDPALFQPVWAGLVATTMAVTSNAQIVASLRVAEGTRREGRRINEDDVIKAVTDMHLNVDDSKLLDTWSLPAHWFQKLTTAVLKCSDLQGNHDVTTQMTDEARAAIHDAVERFACLSLSSAAAWVHATRRSNAGQLKPRYFRRYAEFMHGSKCVTLFDHDVHPGCQHMMATANFMPERDCPPLPHKRPPPVRTRPGVRNVKRRTRKY